MKVETSPENYCEYIKKQGVPDALDISTTIKEIKQNEEPSKEFLKRKVDEEMRKKINKKKVKLEKNSQMTEREKKEFARVAGYFQFVIENWRKASEVCIADCGASHPLQVCLRDR